jgi:hypothetical protein
MDLTMNRSEGKGEMRNLHLIREIVLRKRCIQGITFMKMRRDSNDL